MSEIVPEAIVQGEVEENQDLFMGEEVEPEHTLDLSTFEAVTEEEEEPEA